MQTRAIPQGCRCCMRRVAAVEHALFCPVRHYVNCPLRGLFPFQLGKDQDDSDDASADSGRGIKILLRRNQVNTLVLERFVHIFEIDDRTGKPINFLNDNRVDLPLADITSHLLESRPLQILPGKAILPVHRAILPFTVGTAALQGLNLLLVEGLPAICCGRGRRSLGRVQQPKKQTHGFQTICSLFW